MLTCGPFLETLPGTGGLVPTVTRAGIGLRHAHYAQVLQQRPDLGFLEVHSENFFADGGAALAVLREAREHYDISLHGVGLALGSAQGVDAWHLDRLERLVQRTSPIRVSDHACFARAPHTAGQAVVHGNDLLPVAFTPASLDILRTNVCQVQDRLKRPILLENLSAYLSYPDDSMAEPAFFAALCQHTGCGMLLDVNNLMVNALNAGADDPYRSCCAFIDELPRDIVGEIHLAGYCETEGLIIDDHGSRVRPDVWRVYAHALRRFGAVATAIEWDTGVPALEVLLDEADRASALLRQESAALT